MKFMELEYKYRADHIQPGQFLEFMAKHTRIIDIVTARGRDHFYTNDNPDVFMRYRRGAGHNDSNELTIKKKTGANNSWSRVEVDLPLDRRACTLDMVDEFAKLVGFRPAFELVKTNFVVRTPGITYAYYVVNHTERYLEIEAGKGTFESEQEAFEILREAEKTLKYLNISHSNRTKKSLFELYKDNPDG